MRGLVPIRANLRRIINLSVVIVRACGRSSNHGKSGFGTAVPQPALRGYWMPRLKRGMTTREIGEESSSPATRLEGRDPAGALLWRDTRGHNGRGPSGSWWCWERRLFPAPRGSD